MRMHAVRIALVLAAMLAACAPAPPPPPAVRIAPTVTSAKPADGAAPPPAPRLFSDLGPARMVPQLGVDAGRIALSPDGLLALLSDGQSDIVLQVWDVDRKVVVAELAPPLWAIQGAVGFSKDGRFIIAEAESGAALWDATTGELIGTVQGSGTKPGFDYGRPDPEALFFDAARKVVVLRTFKPGPDLFQVPFADDEVPIALTISGGRYEIQRDGSADVYDRSGKRVNGASAASDGGAEDASPFDPERPGAPPKALEGQVKDAECLSAGGRAVCRAYDGERTNVYVADLRVPGPRLEKLPSRGKGGAVFQEEARGLLLECDGGLSGTFGLDAGAKEIAAAEKAARLRQAAMKDAPGAALVEAKGALLAVIDGRIAVWDVAAEKKRTDIAGKNIFKSSNVAPSPDGKLLAVGGPYGDSKIDLFDLEKGTLLRTLDHGHSLWSLLWNPDGTVLLSTARMSSGGLYLYDENASIKLWSPTTGKVLRTFKDHYNAYYSSDNSLFVTWDYNEVQVYDARTLKKLGRAVGAYMYALLSPDGKSMITPEMDTTAAHPGLYEERGIDVRSTRTGAVIRSFGLKSGVVRWSPDSARLLAATSLSYQVDPAARSFDLGVYSIATGKRERAWSGPGSVDGATWALGGKLVVASVRGMVRLSRTADGASLWIQPVVIGGRCTAVAFEEGTGRFEAEDAALSALGFRLGDDLRRSDVVHAGPKVDALRAPGLYRSFLAAAR